MTTQEHYYSCMVVIFLSPLEDVTQKMFFLQSLSEGFFPGNFLRSHAAQAADTGRLACLPMTSSHHQLIESLL